MLVSFMTKTQVASYFSVIIAGQPMIQHNGIALEAQALPDAIHSDLKDQVILKAGQTFTSKTRYELVVK